MHFSATDLPVPEPPMITIEVPEVMVRFTMPAQNVVPRIAEGLVNVRKLDHVDVREEDASVSR